MAEKRDVTAALVGVSSVALADHLTSRVKANLSIQHLKSAALFAEHCAEIESAETALPWPQPHQSHLQSYASAAVLLAVAALEASINELFLQSIDGAIDALSPLSRREIERLAVVWEEVEGSFSILGKYRLVLSLCGKKAMDRGAILYQSADSLIKLRNALVHFKPEWHDELKVHRNLEERLRSRFEENQLNAQAGGQMLWFPGKCLGAGCAEWAVTTAAAFDCEFCRRLGIKERLVII